MIRKINKEAVININEHKVEQRESRGDNTKKRCMVLLELPCTSTASVGERGQPDV
eukprot:m.334298 g.334298  ORF g.334298 m.334298 type:complete len:55 (-) comp17328_c0_seq1:896-1060(-)